MRGDRGDGLTIIESMLFLAVSGLLVVGILGGTGAAINAQRYRDAEHSLLSYIQGEYDRTTNVQNDRPNQMACESDRIAIEGGTGIGTSECIIVGRLLEVSEDGLRVTTRTVYGNVNAATSTAAGDSEALLAAGLFTNDTAEAPATYRPEWDTIIEPREESTVKLLIVRSPASGSIRTFTGSRGMSLDEMVDPANLKEARLCLNPNGLVLFRTGGVVILANNTSQSGVKQVEEGAC